MVKTFGIPAFWRSCRKPNVAELRRQPCFADSPDAIIDERPVMYCHFTFIVFFIGATKQT
jgi:hypothetical protein